MSEPLPNQDPVRRVSSDVVILSPEQAPNPLIPENRGRPKEWPFDTLEVGGAFPVPEGKTNSIKVLVSRRNHVKGAVKRFRSGRGEDRNYYVWRLPDVTVAQEA